MKKSGIIVLLSSIVMLSVSLPVKGSDVVLEGFEMSLENAQKSTDSGKNTSEKPENSYRAGQYKVGADIPSGEYILFADDGIGYFSVSSDSNQNNIIFNENFEYNTIITVYDGDYLDLARCYAVASSENPDVNTSKTGMFKVGVHIPSGEYKLDSKGDNGYYCIYSSSRQDNIVSNDNFNGQTYVTVSDGQYLKIDRCGFVDVPKKPEVVYTDAETIKKVQTLLNGKGYDCGTADGIAGQKTNDAIIRYKKDNGMTEDATITQTLIDSLTAEDSDTSSGELSSGVSKDMDEIMDRLEKLCKYASVSISDPVEYSNVIGSSVIYNDSNILIVCNPDKNGKYTIGSYPESLNGDKGAQDYIDFLAYFVQAVNEDVSAGDAYAIVMNAYSDETYSSDGIKYTFTPDSLLFFMEY